MGKVSILRPSRPHGPEHQVIDDTREFLGHLYTWIDRLDERGDFDTVALPNSLQSIAHIGHDPDLHIAWMGLNEAWRIVNTDAPVRGAVPHSPGRAQESPRRWHGPLTPREIMELAEDAPADAGSYRANLAANAAFHAAQAARRLELECGRRTASGHPCGNGTVFLPDHDGGAADGLPCWRHATPEETTRIAGIYDAAVRDHDCPGCDATAGRPCYTGPDGAAHLRLVDGEWSRTRSFKGRKVHGERLAAAINYSQH